MNGEDEDPIKLACDLGIYAGIWLRLSPDEERQLLKAGGGYITVTERTKGRLWDCGTGKQMLDEEDKFQYLIEFEIKNGRVLPVWTQGERPEWQYKQLINFKWKDTCGTRGKFETTQVFKLFAGKPRIRGHFGDPNGIAISAHVIDDPLTGGITTISEAETWGKHIAMPGQVIDEISPVAEGWPVMGGNPISRATVRLIYAWACDCKVTERRFDYTDDMSPPSHPRPIPGGPDR